MGKVNVRLMDQERDYKKMGTKKGVIEAWEDGKRDDDRAGVYEWWYFDMILDDGSKAVIHFNTKDNKTIDKDGTIPSVVIKITSPDGKEYKDNVVMSAKDATFGEDQYFTWLCAVPRGTVTGTLYYDGQEHEITGAGYHDHQWGNVKHNTTWDHWIWGRQDFGDYAILVFDIGTQKKFNYQRLPMMFLEDKDGNLVMQDLHTPKCTVTREYKEKLSGKMYPKEIEYIFTDGEKKAKYTITQSYELESRYPTGQLPKIMRKILKMKGLEPSTTRNFAKGKLEYDDGTQIIQREGDMIYEFVYMGLTAKDKMDA